MVSRRIEAAQKKVEERNFDIRKNLLEYDEVMDYQRKRVYGYPPGDPRRRQLQDPHPGHARRADRPGRRALPRSETTAPPAFAEFAAKRLGVEFDAADFARCDFDEADRTCPRQGAIARCRRRSTRRSTKTSARTSTQGVELAGDGRRASTPAGA